MIVHNLLYFIPEVSVSGPRYYAQGIVAANKQIYAASDDNTIYHGKTFIKEPGFPRVASFDPIKLDKKTSYRFQALYDSAPLIIKTKLQRNIIIAHEHLLKRTKAIDLQTHQTVWISKANEPGHYFFSYSYYENIDHSKTIFMAAENGLHALSSEDGSELWHYHVKASGGCTPAVDQKNAAVFYQHDGKVVKILAKNGYIVSEKAVSWPYQCFSSNTAMRESNSDSLIVTYWYGKSYYDSAIRVYDTDLNLLWEKTHLPLSKKATLTVLEDKVVVGSGNEWGEQYTNNSNWKFVSAYDIKSGALLWRTNLTHFDFQAIPNVPYFNGFLYAVTKDNQGYSSKIFRINAETGEMVDKYDIGRPVSSCAPPIIAFGRIFNGDLWEDRMIVIKVSEDIKSEWPSVFFDPQANTYANLAISPFKNLDMQEVITN